MLDHFSKQGNLRIDMPGIAYKTKGGTIIDGGIPELVEDLNGVPFADYSGVDCQIWKYFSCSDNDKSWLHKYVCILC